MLSGNTYEIYHLCQLGVMEGMDMLYDGGFITLTSMTGVEESNNGNLISVGAENSGAAWSMRLGGLAVPKWC